MNFSRCRTFLQLVKSTKNLEFHRTQSNKIVFSSASPQEINVKHKITINYDNNTEAMLDYTRMPRRKIKNSLVSLVNKKSSEARREPSKYFKSKSSEKSIKKPVVEVGPGELYPEGEIDAVDELALEKKKPLESYIRVNHKLEEDPKFKVEYSRSSEDELVDDSELKRELEEFKKTEEISGNGQEGKVVDLRLDEFDMDEFVKQFEAVPAPLDECKDNLSDLGTDLSPTFNFAAYADHSKLVQTFTDLGVKLYKVEQNHDHMRALLTVDVEKELPKYIQFLHDCGVPADSLGDVITENPTILKEELDDLKTRIRYLLAHNFAPSSIAKIVSKNPSWLTWASKHIDERLGHFQNEFKLSGTEIRFLATKQPKLITYKLKHIQENSFAVKEIMGFNALETKVLLLSRPRVWINSRRKIVDSFDYLHNTMKLSHVQIIAQSEVLTTRKSRLKNRHEFLVELKKAQYNPNKIGYVAPRLLAVGSDDEFCTKVAKASVDTYNMFLKTR